MLAFEEKLSHLEKQLSRALGMRYGVSDGQVIVESGADGCLALTFKYLAQQKSRLYIPDPSYTEFQRLARSFSLEVMSYDAKSPTSILSKESYPYSSNSAVLIGTPVNPTGESVELLDEFIEAYQGLIILDDVYQIYSADPKTLRDRLNKNNKLVVIRSFSKVYSRPEIRVGYILSSKQMIEAMKDLRLRYPLSMDSLYEANKLLDNTHENERFYTELVARAEGLYRRCLEAGYRCHYASANFFSVSIPHYEGTLSFIQNLPETNLKTEILKSKDGGFIVKVVVAEVENPTSRQRLKQKTLSGEVIVQ